MAGVSGLKREALTVLDGPNPALPSAAFVALRGGGPGDFRATALTRGPWNPAHQHAGPPIALVCRAIEMAAAERGFTHVARLTANLLRPIPIGELTVLVEADYIGKGAGHFSARLLDGEKVLARFTAAVQRESDQKLPAALPGDLPGHGVVAPPLVPGASEPAQFPFADGQPGYAELVEIREARGKNFQGPCAVWFRLAHPLVAGEVPSPYQRVAVAADSGNGISAVLDYRRDVFVNFDLTINLLRRPVGEWICLDAQTFLGANGGGLAESRLFDENGLVGRATQSLAVRIGRER